jgi:hypothetical protein
MHLFMKYILLLYLEKKVLNEEYLHLLNGYLKHCTTEYHTEVCV